MVQLERKEGINRMDRMNRIKNKALILYFYPAYPVHPV
jgi:hypothetical protein